MKHIRRFARILLGVFLVVFGLNAFFNFLSLPEMPAEARQVYDYMGYMIMYAVLFQILIGICLVAGRFIPLALLVLAPISINILAFHVFFFPAGIWPGLIVALLNGYLLIEYTDLLRPFFRSKAPGK